MTHTAIVPRTVDDHKLADLDMRSKPLVLDTLFGGGPIACRHAYETERPKGTYRLRLGAFRVGNHDREGPNHDLPRCSYTENWQPSDKQKLTEVLIADPRNDDNNLLAQMTVLFSRVYNILITLSETRMPSNGQHAVEDRHRALVAREATVRIYRRILRQDLTRRILQRDVWEHYKSSPEPLLPNKNGDDVAPEFRFGACRVAHAMVRPQYALNLKRSNSETEAIPLSDILRTSSLHAAGQVPTKRDWKVDWHYFFNTGNPVVPAADFNWALRFTPSFGTGMGHAVGAERVTEDYPDGVMMLDLLRDNISPHRSVNDLLSELKQQNVSFENLNWLYDHSYRRDLVKAGLGALEDRIATHHATLGAAEKQLLIDEPPLPLFLLFEAQALGNGGRTHGPLGSILVADAFVPVFKDGGFASLGALSEDLEKAVFEHEISNMADLILALEDFEPAVEENCNVTRPTSITD